MQTTIHSDTEALLALQIQKGFPLEERPYAELARRMDLKESEVLAVVQDWKTTGKLREISAVMEGSLLGYDSALVCGKVNAGRLEQVADIISEHPTVTHNYERNHSYNIWFTIAVPHEQGLENHLTALSQLTGVDAFYPLRRTETFKVGVAFDFRSRQNQTEQKELMSFDPADIVLPPADLVRLAQRDLPVCERPFHQLSGSEAAGNRLLDFLKAESGRIVRRYIGTFRHRKMGVRANGMTVFRVEPGELSVKGRTLAAFPEVSHCYGRTTCPDFPYNLYAMLHAEDHQNLMLLAARLSEATGLDDYRVLESPTEFKKTRLRYFLPELDDYWIQKVSRVS
ncbi:MAG: hypothetical protein HS115_02980 [Spirochaetales bacterium]|nr:hypothetical protein [Spirochaetales bacterium]